MSDTSYLVDYLVMYLARPAANHRGPGASSQVRLGWVQLGRSDRRQTDQHRQRKTPRVTFLSTVKIVRSQSADGRPAPEASDCPELDNSSIVDKRHGVWTDSDRLKAAAARPIGGAFEGRRSFRTLPVPSVKIRTFRQAARPLWRRHLRRNGSGN